MEPLLSLAFSIHSNKGVYAVLLGSGISRSAQIPTGWEIVLKLVRKLAHLQGEECEPNPADWYKEKFKKAPDYAELLELVANTPTERQLLLRQYFEYTADDKDEGIKQPTKAHRAIAQLVADGYIRVIVTTNFDQLMERALIDVGVTPSVVSTYDQIQGTLPLVHQHCCVVKVHGDYLDTRIKNTHSELEAYDAPLNKLLNQIFDEFGLIISGWSADWDVALRAAIERAPSRRFTTYWAARGKLSEPAERLIRHRAGKVIAIKDADSFFEAIQEKVKALEEFGEPHPLSVAAAIATTKRYLAEDKYRIRLHDLIHDEADRAADLLYSGALADVNAKLDAALLTKRIKQYDEICKNLIAIAYVCGFWGDHRVAEYWQSLQKIFYSKSAEAGVVDLLELQLYPISLVSYSFAIGAISSFQYEIFSSIISTPLKRQYSEIKLACEVISPPCFLNNMQIIGRLLPGMENRHVPISDWLHDVLFSVIGNYFPSKSEFTFSFDKVEVVLSLACAEYGKKFYNNSWFPPGAFGYRYDNRSKIISEIKISIEKLGNQSPYVTNKLLGDNVDSARNIVDEFVNSRNIFFR